MVLDRWLKIIVREGDFHARFFASFFEERLDGVDEIALFVTRHARNRVRVHQRLDSRHFHLFEIHRRVQFRALLGRLFHARAPRRATLGEIFEPLLRGVATRVSRQRPRESLRLLHLRAVLVARD